MSLKIEFSRAFLRQAKKLGKKHRSLKSDLRDLVEELSKNPKLGTLTGIGTRKIRMAITSKGKGKSGGGRVITFYKELSDPVTGEDKLLLLVTIYDKSDQASVSDKEIREIIAETKVFEEE